MRQIFLTNLFKLLFSGALGAIAISSSAQGTYPDHPIRMIVPFTAGGGTDVVARGLAKALSERLKQQVVIDNRVGAGSTIGTDIVSKAVADGYTLLFASAAHSFSPTVYAKLPYSQDDFAAIAIVNSTPLMLAVHPSMGVKDLPSFIALLKANPDKYNYASSGVGTTLHIAAEHFIRTAGVKATHIPYKGEAPAMADLLGGQVSFMVGQASTAIPYIKTGRLMGLGVTTPKRLVSIPTVPTLDEAGLPGFTAYGWNAVLVPKGTPRAVIQLLNKEVNAAIASPDVQKTFSDLGLGLVDPTTPETASAFITVETAKWAPVIRAAGIKGE
jgi:tripartite-type tricarboxylate transporter receptor subunit TctC